jgi:hypothetical protein
MNGVLDMKGELPLYLAFHQHVGVCRDDRISKAICGTPMKKDVKQLLEGTTAVVPEDSHQPSGSTEVG